MWLLHCYELLEVLLKHTLVRGVMSPTSVVHNIYCLAYAILVKRLSTYINIYILILKKMYI